MLHFADGRTNPRNTFVTSTPYYIRLSVRPTNHHLNREHVNTTTFILALHVSIFEGFSKVVAL